jgi:RNA-directed DNA polymerase
MVRKPKVGNYKVKIQPSKKKQLDLLAKIKKTMAAKKSISSYDFISMLRPIILGWANYYKYCECKQVFSKLTDLIFRKLRAWVFRRDTRNGRRKVKEKYFPSGKTYYFDGSSHKDNWILNGKKKTTAGLKENFLPHIVWVKSRKHVKVKEAESPYSNTIYWALRSKKHSPYSTRFTKLLQKQNQLCPWCGRTFDTFDAQNWEVDHIIPRAKGGKDTYDNLQLLHKQCHIEKTRSDKKSE